MLTDEQRAAMRRTFLGHIDQLMKPGVKLDPSYARWCAKKREAFFLEEQRVPGDGETKYVHRMLVSAGLRGRRSQWATYAPAKAADYHPEAMAPAALQGSRKPTPMPTWLSTGQGLPLRPPPRRQAART